MEKEFVPYELAVKLKALGFDEPCFGFWTKIHGLFIMNTQGKLNEEAGECLAPTFSQAFRWFREKYKLTGLIEIGTQEYSYNVLNEKGNTTLGTDRFNYNGTYEEAELACIEKLIEIVESKSE